MKITSYSKEHIESMIRLLALNRVDLAELKKRKKSLNLEAAKEELEYYLDNKFPIYIALNEHEEMIGFTVCRVDEEVVWNELLYVVPEERRKGIASALFLRAEKFALDLGGQTMYNWVHPNNHRSIPFLKKHGYNVLNLIEVRKKLPGEKISQKYKIGQYEYEY
jgi:GNAT superfamily N-acetyltransferase